MPNYDFEGVYGPGRDAYDPNRGPIVYETGGLGGVVTIANGLFAMVMITALARSEWSATAAIVTGGLYYGLTTLTALLVLSGSLSQILVNRQQQVTLRRYHELQFTVERPTAFTAEAADPPRLPRTPPADRLPGPLGGRTFVPAEDMTTARDAALWAVSLYGPDGLPDSGKVHLTSKRERPGRLRIPAPTAKQRAWLTAKKVLEDVPNGVRLRVERYPDVQTLRSVLNG